MIQMASQDLAGCKSVALLTGTHAIASSTLTVLQYDQYRTVLVLDSLRHFESTIALTCLSRISFSMNLSFDRQ